MLHLSVIWTGALLGIGVGVTIPLIGKLVVDDAVARRDEAALVPLGLLALALGGAEAFLIFLRRWLQTASVLGVETAIRDDLYRHLLRLPPSFHDRWQSGQLLSRATGDLSAIRRFFGFGLISLVTCVVQMAAVTAVLLVTYPPLGLAVAVSITPVVWLSLRFQRRYLLASRTAQDAQGDLATLAAEAVRGFRTVRAFGRHAHVGERYAAAARVVHRDAQEMVRLSSRYSTLLEVLPNAALALVLLLGALAVGGGALTPGTLVAFTTLVLQLVWPIASLGYLMAMTQEAMTAADRVLEVLDTPPTITGGAVAPERPRGHLRFEGAEIRLPGADRPAVRDVWLDVRPGETVALVGPTGCGKTMLSALVPRLYDVTAGRVTIDGHDVRDLTLSSLRRIVAVVFDDAALFSASVRENITLGRPDAGEQEIREALDLARAAFAYELPEGLDTRVGDQGLSLSGGQRQRLALARAVLARPGVLVLDDPLSALDADTGVQVEEALRRVLTRTTAVVVAHRLSTVLLADRVALMRDGTVTRVGRHEELLSDVPGYRDLLLADAHDLAGLPR